MSARRPSAWVIGTYDTKGAELDYVARLLMARGLLVERVDISTQQHDHEVDVAAADIAGFHPSRADFLEQNEGRGDAIGCMTEALAQYMSQIVPAGAIGLGGSGGTAVITAGMRSLPVGVPKMMVSTVASGQVAPYVGATDIAMMYSITDIAGLNQISHTILHNAASALAGMMLHPAKPYLSERPLLAMTMFGVTTTAVNHIRSQLDQEYESLVFHATGTGGRSMEKLIASGLVRHVIDLTTTEIADLLVGGIMSAGPQRMDAIIDAAIPYVLSVGALDMVNFGGPDTIPSKYQRRLLYNHNPQVTLMRTTPDENAAMGRWIASKINRSQAPVRLYLPELGVSGLSAEGQPFHDPEADHQLFDALTNGVQQTDTRRVIRLPYHINDLEFANAVVAGFRELALP